MTQSNNSQDINLYSDKLVQIVFLYEDIITNILVELNKSRAHPISILHSTIEILRLIQQAMRDNQAKAALYNTIKTLNDNLLDPTDKIIRLGALRSSAEIKDLLNTDIHDDNAVIIISNFNKLFITELITNLHMLANSKEPLPEDLQDLYDVIQTELDLSLDSVIVKLH